MTDRTHEGPWTDKEMQDEGEEVLWQEQQAQEAFYQAWLNSHEAEERP